MKLMKIAASLALALSLNAAEVEVLHWWTSGGEAQGAAELKKMLEAKGHTWKDFAVAGGNASNAMTVLKSRAVSGNPPSSAQIKGPSILEWAELNVLSNLSEVATKEGWDQKIPARFAQGLKYKGAYVAVPVNVHRLNWMWCNKEIFDKLNLTPPTTWEEFDEVAKKIKEAGISPVAQGGQDWQEATLFEIIVLGVGGAGFYNRALVDLEDEALKDPLMVKSFEVLRMVQSYADKNSTGQDWNLATAEVFNGKAAMQFMGDWAKGEFIVAKKKPGVDYLALPAPQTKGSFMYNIDSFAMFRQSDPEKVKAQEDLARAILSPEFQITFNQKKGSVPVIHGMDKSLFDDVAKASMNDLEEADKNGTLVPSMAHQMAVRDKFKSIFFDVVTEFYNSNMSAKDAAEKLAKEIAAEKE